MKQILLTILSLILSLPLFSQDRQVQNLPFADFRWVHYGFSLGTHVQDLHFVHTGEPTEQGEVWCAEVPSYSPGFNVSLMADLYLNPYMNLRFSPGMYFGSKTIALREQVSGEGLTQNLRTNYIALPLSLKFATGRINNYRPYLMTGGAVMVDLSKKEGILLRPKSLDYMWEVGFGCDLYLYYFKLNPELKFSFGLSDMLERNRTDLREPTDIKYTDSMKRVFTRMVTLSFYFE